MLNGDFVHSVRLATVRSLPGQRCVQPDETCLRIELAQADAREDRWNSVRSEGWEANLTDRVGRLERWVKANCQHAVLEESANVLGLTVRRNLDVTRACGDPGLKRLQLAL
jgi:hypothetical protein